MSTDSFEKTNWGWQFSQFQQQVGEWLEYQFSRFNLNLPSLPKWSISPWVEKSLKLLFWIILGLFLAWVVWLLWRKFSPYLNLMLRNRRATPSVKIAESELSVGHWIARSQEFSRQGNYRDACRCLYLAMLQYLHEKSLLPHKLSRTDREYLQLLQLSVTSMQPYETLISTHEQICFTDTEVNRENYEQCQQAYREIADG
ncbi:MAG: DUF4129 domain-containing protein [Rhizonema sp. PD38]|nr:DUF4129 domain-containing protein [Rhizonema sp. PD38]